jgi:hypothetical protein
MIAVSCFKHKRGVEIFRGAKRTAPRALVAARQVLVPVTGNRTYSDVKQNRISFCLKLVGWGSVHNRNVVVLQHVRGNMRRMLQKYSEGRASRTGSGISSDVAVNIKLQPCRNVRGFKLYF